MCSISPQGSKRLFIASLLLLYLLMLALNLFTPFGMDDYYYAFSLSDRRTDDAARSARFRP